MKKSEELEEIKKVHAELIERLEGKVKNLNEELEERLESLAKMIQRNDQLGL